MAHTPHLCSVNQSESWTDWRASRFARKKDPVREETDLTKIAMYPFYDNTQTVPQESVYPLQNYADVTVDGKSPSEKSQKIRIQELTIALQKQHEQTKYFHETLQKVLHDKTTNEHRTSTRDHDTVIQLQADKECLQDIIKDLMDKSLLCHASMRELRHENIELVSKNKIYQMNERMQHLFTN